MAVAHDQSSESHTGTTGSTSEPSFSWSHAGASSGVKGVLVFTFELNTNAGTATSVTYGGVSMTAVTGGVASDTATEPGRTTAWYLGSAVPQGTQTVVVNRTNNTNVLYANAITVTAAVDTEVNAAGILLQQNDVAPAQQSVDDGSIGINSVRYAGIYYGGSSIPTAGANSTALQSIVIGATRSAGSVRETTAGQGARLVGFTAGGADDIASVNLAVREIVSGSGAMTFSPASLAGTGTHTESGTTGTGAFAAGAASFSGTATETFTGTGAPAFAAASFAGTGAETITGTGAFAAAPAVLLGASTQVVTGTGDLAAAAASLAGVGTAAAGATPPIITGSRRRNQLEFKPVPIPIIIGKGGFLAAPASLHGVGEVGPDPVLFLDDELLLLLA